MGEKYEVCPFELQLEAAQEADTVICDYNYVFSPRALLSRISSLNGTNGRGTGQIGQPNLGGR